VASEMVKAANADMTSSFTFSMFEAERWQDASGCR
jgi:hypothetical protein